MDLGSFVMNKIALLDASTVEHILKEIANLYLVSAAEVSSMVAEREKDNGSKAALPPVVPHQLAAIYHYRFCTIVDTHRERLVVDGWTLTLLDAMKQEHKDFVRAISAESALRAAIEEYNGDISFDSGWYVVKGRFQSLKSFVGGIASVFPSTDQVESDFSIVKAEKDGFRTTLDDLSLEGVLHSKQFSMLASPSTRVSEGYANTARSEGVCMESIQSPYIILPVVHKQAIY